MFFIKEDLNMKIKRNSGYSSDLAKVYVPNDVGIFSLSTELTQQVKWIDGKPTDEVTGYQAWFVGEGTEPFKVKFPKKIDLPEMLSQISLTNLEACEVGANVYFKATNIEVIK